MNTIEQPKDSETIRNMSVNVAIIFGVIVALIVVSIYFAENLS